MAKNKTNQDKKRKIRKKRQKELANMYITNENELLERIKIIIKTFAKNKAAVFARAIGVHERNVTRYIKENRGDMFMGYMAEICTAYPTLSEHWLYTGEGKMLVPERSNPIRSITNNHDALIGDLIWVFCQKKNIVFEELEEICNFDETFTQVKESSRFPTFAELETMYDKCGLNPIFLFSKGYRKVEDYPDIPDIAELTEKLKHAEAENKRLSAKLIHTLDENSELNKELKGLNSILHNNEKSKKPKEDVSGKESVKDLE